MSIFGICGWHVQQRHLPTSSRVCMYKINSCGRNWFNTLISFCEKALFSFLKHSNNVGNGKLTVFWPNCGQIKRKHPFLDNIGQREDNRTIFWQFWSKRKKMNLVVVYFVKFIVFPISVSVSDELSIGLWKKRKTRWTWEQTRNRYVWY